MRLTRWSVLLACAAIVVAGVPANAVTAPGAPGIGSAWTSGNKDGLGTSTTTGSEVWYTLGQGILNEVYYPQADTPDVQDLQFMVTDGTSVTDEEKVATSHQVSLAGPRSPTYKQVNTATSGRYRITKTYVTDPARSTVLIQTRFQVLSGGALNLYVLYNPSLGNSGMGDTGATSNGQLVANDGSVASAPASSTGFTASSSGYSGTASDGFNDLTAHHTLTAQYSADTPGNLVQTARTPVGTGTTFTLALGFGTRRTDAANTASASLGSGWAAASGSYQSGWHSYLGSVHAPPASVSEFISHHGPSTPEERWEEAGGHSSSTIAAAIAALVCAANLATANNDPGAATFYLQTADSWQSQVDNWTYTTSGSLAGHGYYERIDDNGNPNDGHTLGIANGGGNWDERTVIDAGFLDLARLGVKSPADTHITDSLSVVDQHIRVTTPEGDVWYRDNHDGYGETTTGAPYTGQGVGRLWPVLTGERGEYAVATGNGTAAAGYLRTVAGSANAGGLVPEQVWDRPSANGFTFGKATGSAAPLAWAQAQFVRLATSISAGHDVETHRWLHSGTSTEGHSGRPTVALRVERITPFFATMLAE